MNGKEPNQKGSQFFDRLAKLDPGGRARLKRSAGLTLNEAQRGALGLFYSILPPGVPDYQQETYFLLATLYPLANSGGSGSLGDALRLSQNDRNRKGLDRRVINLLDADESQLPYRLRRTINFLQSSRVRLNWPVLLDDLLAWSSPYRSVQRRWAQAYFGNQLQPKTRGE